MLTYDWKIRGLTLRPQIGNTYDVISEIHWSMIIKENDVEVLDIKSGFVKLVPPLNGQEFINYDTLTKETIVSWLKDALGTTEVTQIEANAQHIILARNGVETKNITTFPWN